MLLERKSKTPANGSSFYTSPLGYHLERVLEDGRLPYQGLLDRIEQSHDLIDPRKAFVEEARGGSLDALFLNHYSARGNEIVAREVAAYLVPRLRFAATRRATMEPEPTVPRAQATPAANARLASGTDTTDPP